MSAEGKWDYLPEGKIFRVTATDVTLAFPNGTNTTIRRGSLDLPSPDGSLVGTESSRGKKTLMKEMLGRLGVAVGFVKETN